ncbi:MAG: uracil-DNA glycosylase [Desulfurococcales archaeon]|nr:uracil-DNA glycosylase [Desulfurococcales archaeon]MCE4627038.1 uracil-DNA glycosylase [Desulfurococcales archaeon]
MVDAEAYKKLVEEIRNCKKCPLYRTRKNAVPGEGPLEVEVMLIGEAPGRKEDEQGRPFVGMAGKLLDATLEKVGLSRKSVYITNVVKCRPPGNRDPKQEEVQACLPYLRKQIELLRPKVIVALGRISGKLLYNLAGLPWKGISKERGKVRDARLFGIDTKIIATYHPAAALYNPQLRSSIEHDLRQVAEIKKMNGEGKRKTLEDFF